MLVRQSLARGFIGATQVLGEHPIVTHTPARLAMRWVGNHLVPWTARSVFTEGVHEINGVRLEVPRPPDWGGGGEFHMVLGTYEGGEVRFLLSRLTPGDVFVDVGSHVGYVALAVANVVGPRGHVLCLEPTPETFQRLRANVARNGLMNVTLVEAAAAECDGSAQLACSGDSAMWNSLARDGVRYLQVATRSLDSVVAEAGWPSVAGIKIDAEGAEWSVLCGAEQVFHRNPGAFCMFEVDGGERAGDSLRILRHLAQRRYRFSRFTWRGPRPETLASLERRLSMPRGGWANILAEAR